MDQISEYQIDESVNQKKNKMFSLTQMCKIWEKQSFMNIRRVSLSSPKLKKKSNFNNMFKISIGQKHNKSLKVLTWDPKKLTGTW